MDEDEQLKFYTLIDPSLDKTLTNFHQDFFNRLGEKWFLQGQLKI